MDEKVIDTAASLRFGWETLRENAGFLLGLFALMIALALIPTAIVNKISAATGPYLGLPLQLLNFGWSVVLAVGLLKITLKLHDREAPTYADLWSWPSLAVDYL